MNQPEDRVVELCGCRDGSEPLDPIVGHDGKTCVICDQPIVAINIDALLRVVDAAKAVNDAFHAQPARDYGDKGVALNKLAAALDANPGGQ